MTRGLCLLAVALLGCQPRATLLPIDVGVPDTGFGSADLRPPEGLEVRRLLTEPCLPCHQGPSANGELNLRVQAHWGLVNQRSVTHPSMYRVLPGDPENSFLIHKLRGTHLEVGGSGEIMPPDRPMLTPDQIAAVVQWVEDGAPPWP